MEFMLNRYKIILMIAVLIAVPILLSVLATQYESCEFIKKDCIKSIPPDYANSNYLPSEPLAEVVCHDTSPTASEPVYKDLSTGKCYAFASPPGSQIPPNARLVWIGKGEDPRKKSSQDYKEFTVSSKEAWQDTGLVLNEGDIIEIKASGIITFASGKTANPDGKINSGTDESFYAVHNSKGNCHHLICREGFESHTLVGRIGTPDLSDYNDGFNVGSYLRMTAYKSGRLFLGFNDDFVDAEAGRKGLDAGGVSDNSGEFNVVIKIKRKV